jgi:predicted transcriptional regulator
VSKSGVWLLPMENGDGLDRLFFELASESRLGILRELGAKNLRMQEIARKLNLTDTEACRQLQRLSDARLLQKNPDGTYSLTAYAKLVLGISSPLNFIAKFREYFLEHEASPLPSEYRIRLVELSKGQLSPVAMETFNKVAAMLRNAQESIEVTIEVGSDLHLEIMMQRLKQGLKVKWLIQESFLKTAKATFLSAGQLPEIRVTPRISSHLYSTEKEAAFCLRNSNGVMDYSTFFGEDPAFLKWTSDLYNYEWQRAKPWRP